MLWFFLLWSGISKCSRLWFVSLRANLLWALSGRVNSRRIAVIWECFDPVSFPTELGSVLFDSFWPFAYRQLYSLPCPAHYKSTGQDVLAASVLLVLWGTYCGMCYFSSSWLLPQRCGFLAAWWTETDGRVGGWLAQGVFLNSQVWALWRCCGRQGSVVQMFKSLLNGSMSYIGLGSHMFLVAEVTTFLQHAVIVVCICTCLVNFLQVPLIPLLYRESWMASNRQVDLARHQFFEFLELTSFWLTSSSQLIWPVICLPTNETFVESYASFPGGHPDLFVVWVSWRVS